MRIYARERERKGSIKIIQGKGKSGEEVLREEERRKEGRKEKDESELCYESSSCRSVSPEQRKILPRFSTSRVVSDRRTVGILPRASSVRLVQRERARSGQSRSSGRAVRNKGRWQDQCERETE